MIMRRSLVTAVCAVLSVMVFGCGGGGSKMETVPVEGTVSVDGKLLEGPAVLQLTREPEEEGEPTVTGVVSETGSFKLFTYGTREDPDGAPAGKYTVSLATDDEGMSMKTVPTVKPLTIEISGSGDETVKLEIKLTAVKGAGSRSTPDPNQGGDDDGATVAP